MEIGSVQKKKLRYIAIAAVALVLVLFVTVVISRMHKREEQKRTEESISIEASMLSEENEKLKETLSNVDDESYLEKIAREDYDYVKPEERIYYDNDASQN